MIKVSTLTPTTSSSGLTLYSIEGGMSHKTLTGGANGISYLGSDGRLTTSQMASYNFTTLSTGIMSGGIISVGTVTTTFNITAGNGIIVDNYTDPNNPTYTLVSWTAFTAITDLTLTSEHTYIGINSSGGIVQQTNQFTRDQLRDIISIGRLIHNNGIIISVAHYQNYIADTYSQLRDLSNSIGIINNSGNVYSFNGTNLLLNKSTGECFRMGGNYSNSKKDPNVITNVALTGLTFRYRYQNGSGGFTTSATSTSIIPGKYDNGTGTLGTVSNNKWTIQRIYFDPDTSADSTLVFYGPAIYNSQSSALSNIFNEGFVKDPSLNSNYILRGWLVIKGSATDLSNTNNAKFILSDKFGEGISGGFSASNTNLQTAYENSNIAPEIILNSANGGLTISDATTPLGTFLFNITNNANTQSYLTVDSSSISTSVQLNVATIGSSQSIIVTDTGANGANIRLHGNGTTTPSKFIRSKLGNFQIINNSYSAAILTLTDVGALTIPGSFAALNFSGSSTGTNTGDQVIPITSVFGRTGVITLNNGDVTTALGYTPYNSTNPSGYLSSINLGASYVSGATLANIADSTTRFAAVQAGADKTGSNTAANIAGQGSFATQSSVDLAGTQILNKTAANISYTAGGTVDSLRPAEAGADPTASHQSATTASLTGHTQDDLPDGSTSLQWRKAQQDALFSGGENQLLDPGLSSTAFWPNATLVNGTIGGQTLVAGANQYIYQHDGHGSLKYLKVDAGQSISVSYDLVTAGTGDARGIFYVILQDATGATVQYVLPPNTIGTPPFSVVLTAPTGTVRGLVVWNINAPTLGGTAPVLSNPIVRLGSQTVIDAGGAKGYIDFGDNISGGHLNKNLDNLADGSIYGRVVNTHLNGGRPWQLWRPTGAIDVTADNLSQHSEVYSHIGGLGVNTVGAGVVNETTARKWAGETGANITGNHTAADTTKVNNVVSTLISPIGALMPAEAGADPTASHPALGTVIPDTRSDNQLPSWYRSNYPQRTIEEFKYRNVIGVPGSALYVSLHTKVSWGGISGGIIVQEVNSANGVYTRKGSADDTVWGVWYKSYDQQNKADLGAGDVLGNNLTNIADTATRFAAVTSNADNTNNAVLNLTNNVKTTGILSANSIYAGYNSNLPDSMSCSNWFRSSGNTGWYNSTYGTGIYSTDSIYIRAYNGKSFAATDFVITSDKKLKKNIQRFNYRGRLRPRSFTWRIPRNGIADDIGFIAQEVEELYPEFVGEVIEDDGTKTKQLSYNKLTVVLSEQLNIVEDVAKKLNSQVKKLSARLKKLENK